MATCTAYGALFHADAKAPDVLGKDDVLNCSS